MSQNVCPQCGATYDAGVQRCTVDGAALRPAQPARKSTPSEGIGTLVGARATSEDEAQRIKALLAADASGRAKPTPPSVPRPTDPTSRPSVSAEPRRNVVGIAVGVLVLIAVVVLIALAMRK